MKQKEVKEALDQQGNKKIKKFGEIQNGSMYHGFVEYSDGERVTVDESFIESEWHKWVGTENVSRDNEDGYNVYIYPD